MNLPQQQGTSLIEVMVSLVIIAIGLLGLGGLQNTSLKIAFESNQRTQATFLAYDFIDRIRSNPKASAYTLSATDSLSKQNCFAGDTCTPAQLRQFDLFYWQQQIKNTLPDGTATVTYNTSSKLYTLIMNWQSRINDATESNPEEFRYIFRITN